MKNKNKKITLITIILAILFTSTAFGVDELKKADNNQCFKCHGAIGLTDRNSKGIIKSIYINEEKFKPSIHGFQPCQICHQKITQYPHNDTRDYSLLKEQVNNRCMQCHLDIALIYKNSIHYKTKKNGRAAYCSDCHTSHAIYKKQDKRGFSYKNNVPEACSKCHKHRISESYKESYHGRAIFLGSKKAAACHDCHGSHNIVAINSIKSPVNKKNTPITCAKCHFNARENFAEGKEHFLLEKEGPGMPMYYTYKFFTWLTIIVIAFLLIYMELELYRKYKNLYHK